MHIQVVNFRLDGITEAEFRVQCDQLAPTFAAVPGLVSKVWLVDSAAGVYGGVYTWEDQAVCQAYLSSDLFRAVKTHPNLVDVTSCDFSVIEGPTAVTRGLVASAAVV